MIPIYTIGDSHSWHAWLKIPGVITNNFGPMLMHTIGLPEHRVNWSKDMPSEAIICFCWGEIDCRCHIHKYQPWRETIERVVENYLRTVSKSKETHKNIWIYNVVPPPRRAAAVESPGFPFLGSDDERLAYVRYMNELLSKSEFTFVDVYDKYADKDGFLKMELSDGHVHVEDEKPLLEWVNLHRSVGI